MQPRTARTDARWPLRSGRFRFRGAGKQGRPRRCEYRACRPDISWTSPNIRCASRGVPARCAFPRNARPASALSTKRNRARRLFRTDRHPRARPAFMPAISIFESLPYSRKFRDAEIDRAVARVGQPLFLQTSRSARPCRRCDRLLGRALPAFRCSARPVSSRNALNIFLGVFANAHTCAAAAFWMMRSSTSVTFITCNTR